VEIGYAFIISHGDIQLIIVIIPEYMTYDNYDFKIAV